MKEITKEELYKLYIEDNLSSNEIAQKLNTSKKKILKLISEFNIVKSKDLIYKSRTRRTKETNLKRYGTENYTNREKAIQTLKQKYGVINVSQLETVKLKKQKTCNLHYGVNFPSQSINWKNKVKTKNLSKYGYEWFMESPEFWDKVDKSLWLQHQMESKRKNNSFKSSKIENEYYNYLLTKFNEDDIFRQYKEERYPFNCDFYIKSKDLFIELNLHWTHGGKFFDKNSIDCVGLLNKWEEKAKTSQYHRNAIYTWTVRDVEKKNYAEKNNLNYICIYNKNKLYEVEYDRIRSGIKEYK